MVATPMPSPLSRRDRSSPISLSCAWVLVVKSACCWASASFWYCWMNARHEVIAGVQLYAGFGLRLQGGGERHVSSVDHLVQQLLKALLLRFLDLPNVANLEISIDDLLFEQTLQVGNAFSLQRIGGDQDEAAFGFLGRLLDSINLGLE